MRIRKLMFLLFKKIVNLLWGKKLHKISPVYRAFKFFFAHLRPTDDFVEVEGDKIYLEPLSPLGHSIILHQYYETLSREVMRKEIKVGMTAVDLGANIGYHTLLAAKLVGEEGRVFAFEPAPDNYALLIKNINVNNYKNIIPVQKAVSDKTGPVKLYLCKDDTCEHHLYHSNTREEFVLVDSVTLDGFFEDKDLQIDFMKVDIEGAEIAALQGMSGIIKKNKNLKMIIEFYPPWIERAGYSRKDFLDKVTEYGFKLYEINESRKIIEPCDTTSLMKPSYITGGHVNLLCVRER